MSATGELEQILDAAWQRLEHAVRQRHDPYHIGVFATIGEDGPEARYVVLRHVHRALAQLHAHTDMRSPKVAEIERDPRVSWVFFGDEVQFRLSGLARMHSDDDVADAAWARTGLSSRRCYLVDPAPSQILATPRSTLPAALHDRRPTPEESEAGRARFGVIRVTVSRFDWLHLDAHGNRRARFVREDDQWSGQWLAP